MIMRKAKLISALIALSAALLFCSCDRAELKEPELSLSGGYELRGDTIYASYVNESLIYPYENITSPNGSVIICSDDSLDTFLSSEYLDLSEGKNEYYVLLSSSGGQKGYRLEIELFVFTELNAEIIGDRVYSVGEAFDGSTVRVTALDRNGGENVITDYTVEYSFFREGSESVGIIYGGLYCHVDVTVSGNYTPRLDSALTDGRGAVFILKDGSLSLSDGRKVSGCYAVPVSAYVGDKKYDVTEIEPGAFGGNEKLTDVLIPDGVGKAGGFCFGECTSLVTAVFEGDTEPGEYMFTRCGALESVELPESVTSIPDGMFSHCGRLVFISIPSGVTQIGVQSFLGCSSLTDIRFPDKLSEISARAFGGCSALKHAAFGTSLEKLGMYAFTGCGSLIYAVMPENIKTIGEGAFENCSALMIYAVKNSPSHTYAFRSSVPFTPITPGSLFVADGRTEYLIGESALNGDFDIYLYTDSVKRVNDAGLSFDSGYPGTHPVIISSSGYTTAFNVYVSYTETASPSDSGPVDSRGSVYSLNANGTATLVRLPDSLLPSSAYASSDDVYVLPEALEYLGVYYRVTGVGAFVFCGKDEIHRIYLHENVTSIGEGAVSENKSIALVCVAVPAGVPLVIGDGNFYGLSPELYVECRLKYSVMHLFAIKNKLNFGEIVR